MKKIQQVIGEKLTREVSQLMRSPIGQNPTGGEQDSGFTLKELVGEASAESFAACFKKPLYPRHHPRSRGPCFSDDFLR